MKRAFYALFLVFLFVFPFFSGMFALLFATEILILSIFALSFNLLFGYTGLLSFGHAAFFGIGGYAAALLAYHTHMGFIPILLLSAAVAFFSACIIGFFCVRRDEIYFAMLTLGFGMMVFTVVHQWRSVTGGSDGLSGFSLPELSLLFTKFSISPPKTFYFLTLFFFLATLLFLKRLLDSPFGLIIRSIRENPERAAFIGVNVNFYRWVSFVIAGTLAGVAGVLFVFYDRMASPSMVHWTMSARPVLMTILGGARSFFGPVLGALVFYILEYIVTQFTENWMIFLGCILVPIVIFFPDGILGSLERWIARRRSGE